MNVYNYVNEETGHQSDIPEYHIHQESDMNLLADYELNNYEGGANNKIDSFLVKLAPSDDHPTQDAIEYNEEGHFELFPELSFPTSFSASLMASPMASLMTSSDDRMLNTPIPFHDNEVSNRGDKLSGLEFDRSYISLNVAARRDNSMVVCGNDDDDGGADVVTVPTDVATTADAVAVPTAVATTADAVAVPTAVATTADAVAVPTAVVAGDVDTTADGADDVPTATSIIIPAGLSGLHAQGFHIPFELSIIHIVESTTNQSTQNICLVPECSNVQLQPLMPPQNSYIQQDSYMPSHDSNIQHMIYVPSQNSNMQHRLDVPSQNLHVLQQKFPMVSHRQLVPEEQGGPLETDSSSYTSHGWKRQKMMENLCPIPLSVGGLKLNNNGDFVYCGGGDDDDDDDDDDDNHHRPPSTASTASMMSTASRKRGARSFRNASMCGDDGNDGCPMDPDRMSVVDLRREICKLAAKLYGNGSTMSWRQKPPDWPEGVPFIDPNNGNPPDKKKPSQRELVEMFKGLKKEEARKGRISGPDKEPTTGVIQVSHVQQLNNNDQLMDD